jgi:hypothetical protein
MQRCSEPIGLSAVRRTRGGLTCLRPLLSDAAAGMEDEDCSIGRQVRSKTGLGGHEP